MKTALEALVKELTWQHANWRHVSFAKGTYDDTLVVQSPYEGVLQQLVEDLEDAGAYVYYDRHENAISEIGDSDEPDRPQGVSTVNRFEISVCEHNEHPNYA